MRRLVAVAGGTCLAVGIVGVLVLQDVLSAGPESKATMTAVVLLALIPVGFVTMLEALATWPDDGPYPLRRRARSVATALGTALATASVGLLVAVMVGRALLWMLPTDWRGGAIGAATGLGFLVGKAVWLRLRTGRWSNAPTVRQPRGRRGAAA
jgi:hypothetical protein